MVKALVRIRVTWLLVVLVLLWSIGPAARGEQESSWNMNLVGRWIGGPIDAVAVRSSIAYASVRGGLVVADLTTPAAPVELASLALPGNCDVAQTCGRLVLDGQYAYIASGTAGLQIVDISDPSAPFVAGSFDTDGITTDVDLMGNHAYVADWEAGLRILDVSDPAAPREVGFVPARSYTFGVTVKGDRAYLAELYTGLRVIDVSDPAAPLEVGVYGTSNQTSGVAVAGNLAYVACGSDGVRIVDIADPAHPHEVGALDTPLDAFDVAVSGTNLYVADWGYFVVIDVSDPAAPVQRAALRSGSGFVYDVVVSDGLVYVTVGGGGLRVIDVSDASHPLVIGRYSAGDFTLRVAIAGDYAYATGSTVYSDGLRILDVSDPSAPRLAGVYDIRGVDVEVDADHAFVTASGALHVLDLSQPASPVEVGVLPLGGSAFGVAVRNGLAYVANDWNGLRVIDVSNPSLPIEVGTVDTPGQAFDVALGGDHAYVTDTLEGLRIIDISDPAAPVEVGSFATVSRAVSVAVDGDYAYVSVDDAGLVVLDVSDPANPVKVGVFSKNAVWTSQVVVSEGYVFLAYDALGLRVLDASDPANPVEVGYYDTYGAAVGVTIKDGLVYVPVGPEGLYILRRQPPPLVLNLDVQPGACPSRLNVRPYGIERGTAAEPQGVLPVALLGDQGFDVGDVDVSSVRLEGVASLRHAYLDVSTIPSGEGDPACPPEGADGYTDLTLAFSRADVVEAIGATDGLVPLTLVGLLHDGTPFEATDWVEVIGTGAEPFSESVRP